MIDRWHDQPLWGLDTETTGPDPLTALPVSIALVLYDPEGRPLQGVKLLVDPGVDVPAEATAVHGITTDRARQGDPIAVALAKIATFLNFNAISPNPRPVVIFNAPYDWPLLLRLAAEEQIRLPYGVAIVDPLILDRHHDKYRKGLRTLSSMAATYGLTLAQAHDAKGDVAMAVALARAIAARWSAPAELAFPGLQRLQTAWYAEWQQGVNEYWRRSNTREPDGRLRQSTGTWPMGDLDPLTLEPRLPRADVTPAPPETSIP